MVVACVFPHINNVFQRQRRNLNLCRSPILSETLDGAATLHRPQGTERFTVAYSRDNLVVCCLHFINKT